MKKQKKTAEVIGLESAFDFQTYMLAQANKKAAYNLYNYASTLLDLEKVRERAAEVASQAEPINSLADNDEMTQREKMIAIARYVATGRKAWEEKP